MTLFCSDQIVSRNLACVWEKFSWIKRAPENYTTPGHQLGELEVFAP